MNIYDIIREYIEKNGYDGLVSEECGCVLGDLAPCEMMDDCEPAYKWPGDEESAFYMRTVKPAGEENNLLEENPDQNLSGW